MMPNATSRFPRGYSGGQAPTVSKDKTLTGDEDVVRLWKSYTEPMAITNTWAFQRRVLAVAMKMFDTRKNWFMEQDHNEQIHGYNLDFILDTLRFIATGHRRLSVHTWPDLVSHQYSEAVDVEDRHTLADFMGSNGIPSTTVELIQKWCSHPGGVDDMVCTLNILFGDLTIKAK